MWNFKGEAILQLACFHISDTHPFYHLPIPAMAYFINTLDSQTSETARAQRQVNILVYWGHFLQNYKLLKNEPTFKNFH